MSQFDCLISSIYDANIVLDNLLLFIKTNSITNMNTLIDLILLNYLEENYKNVGYIYCIYK